LTAGEVQRRAEADDACRLRQAWQERLDAASRADERKAAPVAEIVHSPEYWHNDDGDEAQEWTPNRAMDLNDREFEFVEMAVEETGQSIPTRNKRR